MDRKIVTIGGGGGTPVVNEALLLTGKVDFITSISAVFDSGGATQRRRLDSRGEEIAYSDSIKIFLSLIDPKRKEDKNNTALKRWLLDRDFKNTVLGHEIFHRFFDREKGFSQIEEDIKAFGIYLQGTVLPSSTEPTDIVFKTTSGRIFKGEHLLDEQRMAKDMVTKMWLSPSVRAYKPTLNAIREASHIFLSCGSLYGSILANFLPRGMKEAFKKSKAKKILITNLVSTRNETHKFLPKDFIKTVRRFTGAKPDYLVVPGLTRKKFEAKYPEVSSGYELEHAHFLGWEESELGRANGLKIVTHQATKIIEIPDQNRKIVRHDPKELARALTQIL